MHGYYPKNSQINLTHTDRWLVGKEKSMNNLTHRAALKYHISMHWKLFQIIFTLRFDKRDLFMLAHNSVKVP